jgi:RND family efflux transporter MFP subunit
MRRSTGVAALVVSFALSSLGGCKREAPPPAAAAETKPNAAAVVARFGKVETKPLPSTLEVSGTLAADETSEVAAPGAGVVLKVEVDAGSRVKKDDVLVRLDGRDAALKIASAQAASAQAATRIGGVKPGEIFDPATVAEVRAAKEAMDLAVSEADRTKALFDGGGISASAWDQARTRAEQAKANYDAAQNNARGSRAAVDTAQAQLRIAQKSLTDMTVRAPFDGAVVERRITAGEFANMGRVVVVVVRDNPLRLRVDVAESDFGKIALGKEVELTVPAYPNRVFKGAIKRIGASVQEKSRTLPVEAEVPNDDGALRPGFFARARIDVGGGDAPALLVPAAAVGTTGTTSRVFVRAGTHVVERLVTVGRRVGEQIEVQGLLAVGDEVAISDIDKLSDGADVTPAP